MHGGDGDYWKRSFHMCTRRTDTVVSGFYSNAFSKKRQEEVDPLISEACREMHTTVQPSPKTMNDAAPAASLAKAGSDVAQDVSSFSSHGKGKKRERSNQDSEPVKRTHKLDDGESYQLKSENILKAEIARITDQGVLVDYESVEKLVHLMVPGKADRKIDLNGRSMLAGVVAATDKFDCLSWFVHLNGLPVFDEWLQDVHKGKIGGGNGHKDGDKSVEEFTLILLRALDKLPVNLQALQMCNIGKSVNHLRSNKNLEIQRKARSLVDTWKKRVEAEMNIDDGKPGSNTVVAWHVRHTSEPSQGGHRNSGSSENAMKTASSQLYAPKIVLYKPTQGDTPHTTASTSPGSSKVALSPAAGGVDYKDIQPQSAAVVESPLNLHISVKDEKSSSSSQSLSQSSSSDHIKTAESSWKEDPRCSTAGSMGAGERLRQTSRPRQSVSGLPGPVSCGDRRDGGSNRSPLHKHAGSENLSHSSPSFDENMRDVPVADGNGKLIVKIPNRARSPAKNDNSESVDEQCPSNSRATSPACSGNHEKSDKGDASDVATKLGHSSDLKDALTGTDEADGTSTAIHDEVGSANVDRSRKMNESPKGASSASNDSKPWKTLEPSPSSVNALVESCIKHSEANALISVVDDVGTKLLASVAACEMSMCESDPTNTPGNTAVAEGSCAGNYGRSLNVDNSAQESTQCSGKTKQDIENKSESTSLVKDSGDGISSINENLATDISSSNMLKKQDDGQLAEMRAISSYEVSVEFIPDSNAGNQKGTSVAEYEASPKGKHNEEKEKKVPHGTLVHSSGGSNDGFENKASECVGSGVHKESPSTTPFDAIEVNDKMQIPLGLESPLDSEKAVAMDAEGHAESMDVTDSNSQNSKDQNQNKTESRNNTSQTTEINRIADGLSSAATDYIRNTTDGILKNEEDIGHCNGGSVQNKSSVFKMAGYSSTDAPRASLSVGMEKLRFDLNEGFTTDEVKNEEQKSICGVSCPAAVHVVSPLLLSAVSNSLPPSVNVAAAAKGAFIPPEDLLRARGELGWKGSAATSAFRPADPRKISEPQVITSTRPDALDKSGRPFLNIDLNVADDSMQDEVSHGGVGDIPRSENCTPARGFGGLDLDLNQLDDAAEMVQYSVITNRKVDVPGMPFKPVNLSDGVPSGRRNFDLNDGPMHEDVGAEPSILGQNFWSNMPSQPPIVGLRMDNAEMGNLASWFPQGSVIPAVLPDRADQSFSVLAAGTPQRIFYTPPGSTPFAPDVYRGPVLSSSPALSYPSAPYQYPMFPFGTNFPVPSATLPGSATYMDSLAGGGHNLATGHSQYLGHPGIVSSGYHGPYLVSMPDGRSNGGLENSNRWGSHGLDLNSGPGSIDVDNRNDLLLPIASRQFSAASSQAVLEEQMRMFQASGAVLKRKEPDGGWDAEKPKQPSWL